MRDYRQLAMLALSLIFPTGNAVFRQMYSQYENGEDMLKNILKYKVSGFNSAFSQRLNGFNMQNVCEIYDYCLTNGIEILTYESDDFPYGLSEIDCPPIVLYCKGDLSVFHAKHSVSIVGARKACDYSLKAADIFSYQLAESETVIISGFANGIDTAAHNAAIRAGGKTVAVLGCGIDYDYPKGKSELKKNVWENGLVISEYPPLASPEPNNFRVRNRLISALSQAILVVQAGKKSGSLNTVSHGLEQGKDIYVIPPKDIFSPDFAGQTLLLKDGAQAVYSPHDILINL